MEAGAQGQAHNPHEINSQEAGTMVSASLNPDAITFVSLASSHDQIAGHTQKKNGTRKKKNTIPVDPAGVELEFLKVEISTLQAKMQKQETELKDFKFRNSILMARNKTLEEAKKQSIHDQYFPQQPSATNPHPQPTSHCRVQPCCSQHHCGPKLCPCSCQSTPPDSISIESVNDKVAELSRTVQGLTQILESVMNAKTDPHQPTAHDPGSTLSQGQGETLDSSPAGQTPSQDMESSTISIDGFMFEAVDSENDLN